MGEINFKIVTEVIPAIQEEISRSAARSYSEDGVSLYDALVQTSRDTRMMDIFLKESLAIVQGAISRFVATITYSNAEIELKLNLSERRLRGKEDAIKTLVKSTLGKIFISKYFSERQSAEIASHFDEQAAADLQMLVKLLFEKSSPIEG